MEVFIVFVLIALVIGFLIGFIAAASLYVYSKDKGDCDESQDK